MKILDIINPHETLDENLRTDAQELAKRAGTKIRNTANDVGERFNISWLRRAESQGVSNHIDQMLTTAGKDLKRSPDLADAERVLLDLEKTVKYDRAGKKQFEEIGDTLADALYARKESSLGGANPIDVLERMYKNSPNPPVWMSNNSLQLKRFDPEYLEWLTKSVDAKIVARREVDLAPKAPPKAKTKAERDEEEITDQDRTNRKNRGKLEAKKIDDEISANKKADKMFQGMFMRSMSDEIFVLGEGGKIWFQYKRSKKNIDEWEASGKIPEDVASFFPPVPENMPDGSFQKGGDKGKDERKYVNEQQRVAQAADWARTKLTKQMTYQILGGTGAFIIGHGVVKAGAGTFGGARNLAMASKILEKMSEKASVVTTPLMKVLAGVSITGKYLFADYFLSAVDGEQINSRDSASIITGMGLTYQDLTIDHTADINKAVASLFLADTYESLESAQNSAFAQQVYGAWQAAKVPFNIVTDPFQALGAWIWKYFHIPEIDVVPPASSKIPGTGEPVKPQTSTQTNTAPPVQNVPPPENTQVTSTAPPAPVNTNTPVTTTNNGIRQRKLDETLKYKVLSRMKS